jgi:putative redox protein
MAGKIFKAEVRYAGDDLFVGFGPGGHAHAIETNSARNSAVTPMGMLLTALGACTGIDVVSILRKKREPVDAYRVELTGDRREEHPRKFDEIRVHHVLHGARLSEKAVQQAIELSDQKYCSVAATLRPGARIVSSFEIVREPAGEAAAAKT